MPLSIHLLAAVVVLVAWLGLVAALILTAPVAYQDRNGFRYGEGADLD